MALGAKKYIETGMKRRIPDAKIHVTNTIVLIEYKGGNDLVIARGNPRAERIAEFISK